MKDRQLRLSMVAVLLIVGPGLDSAWARGGMRRGGGGRPPAYRPAAPPRSAPAVTSPSPSAPAAVTPATSAAARPGASQPTNVYQPRPGQPTNVYQPRPGQPTNVYRPTGVQPTNVWQPSPGTPTNVYRPTSGGPSNVYQPVPGSARSVPPGTGIINAPGLANNPSGVVYFPSTPNINRPISVVPSAPAGMPGVASPGRPANLPAYAPGAGRPPRPTQLPSNPPWYHGSWHNGWNSNTARNAALLAAGGAIAYYPGYYWWYDSGYYEYENPYYEQAEESPTASENDVTASVAPDYSEPVISSEAEAKAAVSQEGIALIDQARGAFLHGDYDRALQLVNQAAAAAPNDPMVHEFRSLVLFALGKYSEAAAAIHSVLAVKPGWDWTTLLGLYPDQAAYREQLAALEKHCAEHPEEGAPRFLLAYHQLTAGKIPEAQESLKKVVELTPQDPIAASLLKLTSGEPPATAGAGGGQAGSAAAAVAPWENQPDLKGAWKAEGRNGVKIDLVLDESGAFKWTVTSSSGTRDFAGTYSYSVERLVLTREDANSVVGAIAPAPDGGFRFRPDGAAPADPGVVFMR